MSFKTSITSKRFVAAAVIPAAVLASGGMVWASSYSAFSASTSNPTSNWTSGTVALADDDSNTAMFNAGNLKPSATAAKCITVTSSGSLGSSVKLYGTDYATTKGLADHLNLKVEEGTGGSAASCDGFTASGAAIFDGTAKSFGTTKTSFTTGVGSWTPAGGTVSKTYKITYSLASSTPDTAQGGTAGLGFTWEAQNN
jgi:hypothetical protein